MTTPVSITRFSKRLLGSLAMGSFALMPLYACSEAKSSSASVPQHQAHAQHAEQSVALDVFKSPTCGCCGAWVTHIEKAGFTPDVTDSNNMNAVKQKFGIEPRMQSCHTSVTEDGNYFFEGHIPAKYIEQFLKEKPQGAAGLAVPGMPLGSPGMEMDGRFQPYHIVQINRDGSSEVFATVEEAQDQH